MKFEWSNLLEVVSLLEQTIAQKTLSEASKEALLRSAYNRLYYTVYNTVLETIKTLYAQEYRDFLKEWKSDPVNNQGGSHKMLSEYCLTRHPSQSPVFEMGNCLHQMRPLRHDCDYNRPLYDANLLDSLEDYKQQANFALGCIDIVKST